MLEKKHKTISNYNIVSIIIIFLSCYLSIINNLKWTGFIAGVILMGIAIVIHFIRKKEEKTYLISYFLNTIGMGLSISTIYTDLKITFNIECTVIVSSVALVLTQIFLLLIKKSIEENNSKYRLFYFLVTILLIFTIVIWIINKNATFTTLFSYSTFMIVHMLFYLILLKSSLTSEEDSVYKKLSSYSFGLYFIIAIIVLIVLSEGDFIDFDWPFEGKKKKIVDQK